MNRKEWLLVAGVFAILVFAVILAMSMMPSSGYGMMGNDNTSGFAMMGGWGGAWWVMLIPMLFALVFFVLLIYLVVWMVVRMTAPSGMSHMTSAHAATGGTPLEIVEARYAKGEITREEYLKMREDLSTGPSKIP